MYIPDKTSVPFDEKSNRVHSAAFLTNIWDARVARVICTALLFTAALTFLHAARGTLVLLLLSILFAYFLAPLVAKLEHPVRSRVKALLIVYACLVLLLAGLSILIGSKVASQARELAVTLPSLVDRLSSGDLLAQFGQRHHWSAQLSQQIQDFIDSHKEDIGKYGKLGASKLAQPLRHIWWLVLIPILSFFLLKQGKSIAEGVSGMGRSDEEQNSIRELLSEVNTMLGGYVQSQIILAALTMVVYTVVLGLMQVPYSFILGPAAGLLEFVPIIGTAIATTSVLVIAALAGYPHVLWLMVFLIVWRLLQDYVNSPRIMGKTLEIDPLVQILAVLAGGEAAGVLGALISVPVAATLGILWRYIRGSRSPLREVQS